MTQVSPDMVERAARAIYEGRNGKGCKPWSLQTKAHKDPYLHDALAALTAALGIPPADGHGYSGAFTAKEFNERALDHDKAARNGLAAGPNVSYVRTFQACAVALRLAADLLPAPTPEQQQ